MGCGVTGRIAAAGPPAYDLPHRVRPAPARVHRVGRAVRLFASRNLRVVSCMALCLFLFRGRARGEDLSCPEPPPYERLRYEEDYTYLRDMTRRCDVFDRVKYVPLGGRGERYFTVGGEARTFLEWFRDEEWGAIPGDDGYLLQRFMLHGDLHWSRRTRLFVQLKSGLISGRSSDPRPTDEDRLDVHQAFIDFAREPDATHRYFLRLGRQEMDFGHSRLVSYREGPNVRRSFDGVRIGGRTSLWTFDAFVTKPVETNAGVFDDGPEPGPTFWGFYASRPLGGRSSHSVDAYYLCLARAEARYDQGAARETRHTIGARLWGGARGWDYDVEVLTQLGTFGDGEIRAWSLAPVLGYTARGVPGTPRFALSLDVHSGDRDPRDPDLSTYHPLFPKGAYYGLIAPVGPSNHWEIHPIVEMQLGRRVTVRADWLFFWRQSVVDGTYDVPGNLLRSGQGSRNRFVGHSPGIEIVGRINRHLSVTGDYARFAAGRFLQETGPSETTAYMSVWATYKF